MDIQKKTLKFEDHELIFDINRYAYSPEKIYIGLIDTVENEPYSDLTINLPNVSLEKNQICIDPINETVGLVEVLINEGLIKETHERVPYNYGDYLIATIDFDKLKEYQSYGIDNSIEEQIKI